MKKNLFQGLSLGVLTCLLLVSSLRAEERLPASLHLVRDIGGSADQVFTDGSNPRVIGAINEKVFFIAQTNVAADMDNDQLWRSDGTAGGTFVLPLQPTSDLPVSVDARSATPSEEYLYFNGWALDGAKMWRTNGEAASTSIVFTYPSEPYSGPERQVGWQNAFFFSNLDTDNRYWLYKVANSAAEATRLKRFERSLVGTLMRPMIILAADSLLYIFLTPDNANLPLELWGSDGTEEGTQRIRYFDKSGNFAIESTTAIVGDILYFVEAPSDAPSFRLWKSDGTEAGTQMVAELSHSADRDVNLTAFHDKLYLTASDNQHGSELWTSDGTITGTVMLQEIHPGIDLYGPTDLYVEGDYIYFRYPQAPGSQEMALWRTDGSSTGAEHLESQLLNDVAYSHAALGDSLYYYYNQEGIGRELWQVDLNGDNAQLVADILPGRKSSIANAETIPLVGGDKLYFPADDGIHGTELWMVDSTTGEASLAIDVNKREITPLDSDPDPSQLANGGERLFFVADDGFSGEQIWLSDGAEAGTQRVENAELLSHWSAPRSLTRAGAYLYFLATSHTQTAGLWRTDGTDAGTALVMQGEFEKLTESNGALYFVGENRSLESPQSGLWKIEPATQTPMLLHETGVTQAALPEWIPTSLTPFSGLLYFQAALEEFGSELWRTDGTAAGTIMVADQVPGPEHFGPANLTVVGSTLFFTANVQRNGTGFPALWRTDGTAAGIQLLKVFDDLSGGSSQGGTPSQLTAIGNLLYFALDPNGPPMEVWRSDGTPQGTIKLATVAPPDALLPYEFTNVNGLAYFGGASQDLGHGIWRSDGTSQGTQQVLIFPYQGSPQQLTRLGNTLFFRLRTDALGTELWMLNESEPCFRIVTDIFPGVASAEPQHLTQVADDLYFVAEDGKTGGELYVLERAAELDCTFPYAQYLPFATRNQ